MSRIGNKPVPIPTGVQVELKDGLLKVKGKHGELSQALPPLVKAEIRDGQVFFTRDGDAPSARAYHGLARSLVANCVKGVAEKYEKKLELIGIGYRAVLEGKTVSFNVGHSHAKVFQIPEGIEVEVAGQTKVTITGIDKQKVGQAAAKIRDFRRPDPYKGKGIRYLGEHVRQKVGKSGAK